MRSCLRESSLLLALQSIFLSGCSASALPEEFILTPGNDRGAVASESAECSRIGKDILATGGNAIDALVGTQLCVGVVGMYHSGIGGGGFAIIRDSEGHYEAVDFRETAPAQAFEDMYKDHVDNSIFGGLAAGVPSELRGLDYIHKKHGRLPWEKVAMPASQLARDGFPVSEDMVRYMVQGISQAGRNFLVEDPDWAQDFAPNGTLVGLGDIITRKRYADTLETVAKQGAEAFYDGYLATSFVKTVQASGGVMTLQDVQSYRVACRPALNTTYRGYRLFSTGVPASGAVSLNILKILEQYDPNDPDEDVNLRTHRFDEAMRFAYGARVLLGDPDFVEGMDDYEAALLDEIAAKDIRNQIRDDTTLPVDSYDPHEVYSTEGFGTSHVVTADRSGLAGSLTSTVNLLFGALIVDPATGVILNNEMNDFSIPGVRNAFGFEPSAANFIRPGKRPLSSVAPIIVERGPDLAGDAQSDDDGNGSLYLVVGAAGGSRIISATAQVVWHVLEHGMTIGDALLEPRLHDQLMPNEVLFEYKFDNDTVASMKEKGHDVAWVREGLSAVQGIRVLEGGVLEAAGEPRQGNSAGLTT